MDNLNLTISLIGSICGLIMLGVLVWCMWLCTKFFGIKGFLRFVGVVILPILIAIATEKFLDNTFDDNPALILIILGIFAIFLIWVVVNTVMTNLNSGEDSKRKFIKDLIRDLKNLGIALLGGVVIVGLIVVALINN